MAQKLSASDAGAEVVNAINGLLDRMDEIEAALKAVNAAKQARVKKDEAE